jgi:hypothetical protein
MSFKLPSVEVYASAAASSITIRMGVERIEKLRQEFERLARKASRKLSNKARGK